MFAQSYRPEASLLEIKFNRGRLISWKQLDDSFPIGVPFLLWLSHTFFSFALTYIYHLSSPDQLQDVGIEPNDDENEVRPRQYQVVCYAQWMWHPRSVFLYISYRF